MFMLFSVSLKIWDLLITDLLYTLFKQVSIKYFPQNGFFI